MPNEDRFYHERQQFYDSTETWRKYEGGSAGEEDGGNVYLPPPEEVYQRARDVRWLNNNDFPDHIIYDAMRGHIDINLLRRIMARPNMTVLRCIAIIHTFTKD